MEPARGDDDQPADGGFGRVQQPHDPPPDPARHVIRAAIVQPGHEEQRRHDAHKRRAVARDRRGPAEGLRVRHPGKGKGGGEKVDGIFGGGGGEGRTGGAQGLP